MFLAMISLMDESSILDLLEKRKEHSNVLPTCDSRGPFFCQRKKVERALPFPAEAIEKSQTPETAVPGV